MNNRKSTAMFSSTRGVTTSLLALVLCAGVTGLRAHAGNDNRAPEVPAAIQVPEGNKVSFHAYAVGVQIYHATLSPAGALVWTFTGPEAVLYDSDGNVVGIHYASAAGPTRPAWETESGSLVIGAVVPPRVTVDSSAIPWLLLRAVTNSGPGVLDRTTYIQRVNTAGGLAPATAPAEFGQEARVPYTAEYYFYREAKQ